MKALRFGTIILGLAILLLTSFSVHRGGTSVASCSIEINELNDSTFIVEHNTAVMIETKIVSGSPSVEVSNDTITVSGASYVVGVYIYGTSSECAKTKLITKLN